MIPKRKLIKKLRAQQKPNLEQTQVESHQSIFDKIKSIDTAAKEEAVTILANLHIPMPQFMQPEFSRELVNLLYQANNTLVCQTIFAMANLCEIEPGLTRMLFDQGLDKALLHLPSTNNQLLKPILIFFITVCESLPKKYHYLLQGIRNSLTVQHFNHSPDLCLEFMFRTYNQSEHKLSQPVINAIGSIYKSTESVSDKSYCVAVMAKQLEGNKQVQEILINYMTELLVCIDLAKQYQMNFFKPTKPAQSNKVQQPHNQQQQMQQDHHLNKQQQQQTQKIKHHPLSLADREKLKFFNQTISAIEILLEFVLDVLEKEHDDSEQEDDCEDDDDQGMAEEEGNNNNQTANNKSQLKELILHFIKQNMPIFPKFLSLSSTIVPDSENVVYLFYHLLIHIDRHIQSCSPNNQQVRQQINQLVTNSLWNLFASVESVRSQDDSYAISLEQYETLVQCMEIGLGILMKNKAVGVTAEWLIGFGKNYMMAGEIFKSFKLLEQLKPCWLIMLQLYSKVLNPEKNKHITPEQNLIVGQILKHLLINLPYTELEQFRCQVIDTVYDVYSNQNFDQAFVQLGYFELLQAILKQGQSLGNKNSQQTKGNNKKQTRKQQKFIQDVLKDLRRFLEYKHKMVKK